MKRIIGGYDFGVLLYLFTQLLYVFLQDVFTMFSGKLISAVNVLMTTSASLKDDGGVSFLLEVVVATVAFFVVVVLLTSLDAMFSFHRYRHNNDKNEIKWLKNTKKIARKLTSRFATLCVLEKPIS